MKLIKTLVVACAFSAVSAYAVDSVKLDVTSVAAFTEEKVTEVALVTEDDHSDDVVTVEVEEVAALPTTG